MPTAGSTIGWARCRPLHRIRFRQQLRLALRARHAAVAALALSALLLLAIGAQAAKIQVPAPISYVSDFAQVIDPATEAQLNSLISELKAKSGAEIAVVTVRSTKPETAFDYGMAILETWKPGAAGKDNGVVLLAAIDDRQLQILTGYGAEGALPDGRAGEIRDRILRPAFRAGQYSAGLRDATLEIAAILARDAGVTLGDGNLRPGASRQPGLSPLALLVLVVAVIFIISVLSQLEAQAPGVRRTWSHRSGWGGGGGFGDGGFGGFSGGASGGLGGGGFDGFGGGSGGGGGAGGDW